MMGTVKMGTLSDLPSCFPIIPHIAMGLFNSYLLNILQWVNKDKIVLIKYLFSNTYSFHVTGYELTTNNVITHKKETGW